MNIDFISDTNTTAEIDIPSEEPVTSWPNFRNAYNYTTEKVAKCSAFFYPYIIGPIDWIRPVNHITKKREFQWLSAAWEESLGNKNYLKTCNQQGGRTHHRIYQYFAERIGKKIAAHAQSPDRSFDYEFTVLNSNELNAWAMPGGKIAINQGLIQSMDAAHLPEYKDENIRLEDKVAAVLAHEIAHAAIGHTRQRMQSSCFFSFVASVGEVVLRNYLDKKHIERISKTKKINTTDTIEIVFYDRIALYLYDLLTQSAISLTMLSHSRDCEYEADRYGMILMKKAGYNPKAAVWLQQYFQKHSIESFHGSPTWSERFKEWFSTHPNSTNRLEANENTLKELVKDLPEQTS